MGVPKFFRWLSERYPCLCEELKEYQIPEFDNLYLDMNGIIHVCSHPNDFDPHFRITEEQIFTGIFHYIEVLFRLIRPQKLFFMAVDGVAPRAKMNQQRGRRFCSAKEAENLEKKALEKGEDLPSEKRFDSNCITPGTKFMAKLQEQLKYFVANKISNDKLWQKPTIILSGHSVPGEGEHKIMDYIRYLRSKPDWDPHTRHCLYGLDADLIILGLCTHEPNFSLLREEVKFVKSAKNKKTATPETTNYNLLHLSLLRGYLDLEFQSLKNRLPFPYDIEKIIDDWVLMGFLVGNDFIPHLPHLHIHCNALGILYGTYRAVLPTLDGYINEGGNLNLERFEKFLVELSNLDTDTFNETYADMKYFENKTGKKLFPDADDQNSEESRKPKVDEDELRKLIESTELQMFDFCDNNEGLDVALEEAGMETLTAEEEEGQLFFKEFKNHKRNYYLEKMKYPNVSEDVLRKEAEGYVLALQWILFYYYKGCPSWSWYYPHHYSPYVSDLKGFGSLIVSFKKGTPFLPFQQLLAVLPAASKEFLPEGYQTLMVSTESPIIDYYPTDFKSDLNGKKQEWEAVVLIPFIEEERLLGAMEPFNEQLTDEEKFRNSHGPMQIYNYSSNPLGTYTAPEFFPDITSNHAKCLEIYPSDIEVPLDKLVTGRHPSLANSLSIYMPGFPVLSALNISGSLEKKGVKVFDYPSRGENMILKIKERPEFNKPLGEIANDLMNRDFIYVSYPHLTPARVMMLSSLDTSAQRQSGDKEGRIMLEKNNSQNMWTKKMNLLKETHMSKFGIDISNSEIIIYANPLEGTNLKFSSNGYGYTNMIWGSGMIAFPLDTCLAEVNQREQEKKKYNQHIPLSEVFPTGANAYMLGPVDYGSCVKVKEVTGNQLLIIESIKTSEPDLQKVKKELDSSSTVYYPGYACGQRLGISPHFFARITSGIIVQSPHTDSDKINIGLSLKHARTSQQMVGFTKKEGNMWLYSNKAIDMVRDYMDKFPDLFEYLSQNMQEDIFFKDKMFPNEDSAKQLNEIRNWLKALDKGELRSIESEIIEPSAVKLLEEVISEYKEEKLELKTIKLKPHYLYLPRPDLMIAAPDPDATHQILDRIVYVRECHSIPIGSKGTIIGVEKKTSKSLICEGSGWEEAATLYDVLFDNEVVGGQAVFGCTKKQIYRLTKQVFINISYGQRKYNSPVHQNNQETRQWRAPHQSGNNQGGNNKKDYNKPSNSMMAKYSQPSGGNQTISCQQQQRPPGLGGFSNNDSSLEKQTGQWRAPHSSCNNKREYNKPSNSIMAKYSQISGGNQSSGGQQPQAPPGFSNDDSPSEKPSGSVTNFFNAYRNSVNNNPEERTQVVRPAPLPATNVTAPPLQQMSNDPTALTDMWNLLKNLQVKNADIPEAESTNIPNQSVIVSQTFTRSNSSQQLPQQPSRDNIPPGGDSGRPNSQSSSNNSNPHNSSSAAPAQVTIQNQFIEQTEALKKLLCIKPGGNSANNSENNNLDSNAGVVQKNSQHIRPLMEIETESNKTKRWSAPVHGSAGAAQFGSGPVGHASGKSCGHLPSCMPYYLNLCTLYMMDEPVHWLNTSEDGVVAYCRLADGFQFCGPVRPNNAQAKEAMACKGISVLSERYGPPKDLNSIHNPRRQMVTYQQPPIGIILGNPIRGNNASNRGSGFMPPQSSRSGRNSGHPGSNESMDGYQWRQQASHHHADSNYSHQQQSHPANSSNHRQNRDDSKDDGNKKRNRRKVRIAANFHNPINQN